jgi:hypothetical protein
MKPSDAPQGAIGIEFALALVAGEFVHARECLSKELAAIYSAEALGAEFTAMIEYYGQPVTEVEVVEVGVTDEGPGKQPGDVGWAYVAMTGNAFTEVVVIVAADFDGQVRIRELEWGRA